MKNPLLPALLVFATVAATAATLAQPADRAALDKAILANERKVNEAFAKNDAAGFQAMLTPDAFALDPMVGLAKASDFVAMMKDMKVESWNIDQSKVYWVDSNTAIHTYRWTGKGTWKGEAIPSPTWASTVWVNRGGKWLALFHQETPAMPPPPPAKKK